MAMMFPGTTIETSSLERGSSRQLLDGIFATGGVTLSQVSIMTGLEPYLIQNWVKRGFLSPPIKRVYSREQFARILLINMLRDALQLEQICGLLEEVTLSEDRQADGAPSAEELYHRYVDLRADGHVELTDEDSVRRAAEAVLADRKEGDRFVWKRSVRILQIICYAHASAMLRRAAENAWAELQG